MFAGVLVALSPHFACRQAPTAHAGIEYCNSDGQCDVRYSAALWLLMADFAFEFRNCFLCHWFLFGFFSRSSSVDTRYRERSSSFTTEANPGAKSFRMTVGWPTSGLIPT